MDDRRRTFMRELERALLEALSESAEVHRTLHRMHREGYTLQLFLDCQPAGSDSTSAPGPAESSASDVPAVESRRSEPAFRINSDDLSLLRALGIDPTRKSRVRK
ncbi:MAG: hypothetical protein ABI639_07970 [Thermoanaerobaculia bacterium]